MAPNLLKTGTEIKWHTGPPGRHGAQVEVVPGHRQVALGLQVPRGLKESMSQTHLFGRDLLLTLTLGGRARTEDLALVKRFLLLNANTSGGTAFRATSGRGASWRKWPRPLQEWFPTVLLGTQGDPELHDMFWVLQMF